MEYRKGKLNVAPDALSRRYYLPGCSVYTNQKEEAEFPITPESIWKEQHHDYEIRKIFQALAMDELDVKEQYAVLEDKLYHTTHLADGRV